MYDIYRDRADCWCKRLSELMKRENYTQKTFLKEYRLRYGGGTQANISRWLRVGSKLGNGKTIGFPSYETMLNLAEFFGVTVGYLTGETDYESFEMEKACDFLNLEEDAVKAIKSITSGRGVDFHGEYMADEYKSVLRYALTASSFNEFIKEAREYAENIYCDKHLESRMERVGAKLDDDVRELAYQCVDYQRIYSEEDGNIDDFKDNNVEPTDKLLDAIKLLNEARDYDYDEKLRRGEMIKLSEYELQKIYFEVIKELVKEEHLPSMVIPMHFEKNQEKPGENGK